MNGYTFFIHCDGPDYEVFFEVLDHVEGTHRLLRKHPLKKPRMPHVYVMIAKSGQCIDDAVEYYMYVDWDLSTVVDILFMTRCISAAINYAMLQSTEFMGEDETDVDDFIRSYNISSSDVPDPE